MANNDYWAYLRNENELKHYRTKISEGGSPNGFRKDGSQPVGQKRKGILDAAGNYIYETTGQVKKYGTEKVDPAIRKMVGNIRTKVGGAVTNVLNNIRTKANNVPANFLTKLREKNENRTSYGDMMSPAQKRAVDRSQRGEWFNPTGGTGGKKLQDQDIIERQDAEERRRRGKARNDANVKKSYMYDEYVNDDRETARAASKARNEANTKKAADYEDAARSDELDAKLKKIAANLPAEIRAARERKKKKTTTGTDWFNTWS